MKRFIIVIPSYNNKDWYRKNLMSVLNQKYPKYRVIYTDDCSPDGTGKLVEEFLKKNKNGNKVKLIKNKKRVGAMKNLYDMIHSCDNEEIVITADGDDWLAHNNVLTNLNKVYSNPNVWVTYGQYRSYPDNRIGCSMQIPPQIIQRASYRQFRWCSSHLRTFYTWIFKKIKKEDFIGADGKFYATAWDLAIYFALLELSGQRAKFLSDVSYIYNVATPLNDSKLRLAEQQNTERIIRAKPKYQLLVKKP
jgi:glycosyltransferase involved in cell wall biosynthesis